MMLAVMVLFLVQDDSARAWVEKLRADKIEERDEAARRLRSMGKSAVPELEKAAKDSDAEVAARATGILRVVNVIGALTPRIRKAMPQIEQRLVDEFTASEIFLTLSLEKYFPALRREDFAPLAAMAVAGARSDQQKERVCAAAVKLDLHEAVPGIFQWAEEGRVWAIVALARLHAREAAPRIAVRLADPNADVRRAALLALADLEAKEALPEILKLLDDPKTQHEASAAAIQLSGSAVLPEIRKRPALCWALEYLAPDEAAARYMELIRKQGRPSTLIDALGRIGAVAELRVLLGDSDQDTRLLAAQAIQAHELKGAEREVRELLGSGDEKVRRRAERLMVELPRARRSAPELMKALEDKETAPEAIVELAELGVRDAIPAITKLVSAPDSSTRAAAMEAVGRLRAGDATAAVAARLAFEEEADLAIWALGRLGAKEHLPAILKALAEGHVDFADVAAEAILKLGAKEALPEIEKLLAADDYEVRYTAVQVFARVGGEAAVPRLLGVLEDGEVRDVAAPFLCAAGRREAVPFALNDEYLPVELNALRSPGAWKALAGTRLDRKLEGRGPVVAAEVARRLGLALEWSPPVLNPKMHFCGTAFSYIPRDEEPVTLLSELQRALYAGSTFILEPGRLRVLPRGRAHVLWREWWDAEEKRAK